MHLPLSLALLILLQDVASLRIHGGEASLHNDGEGKSRKPRALSSIISLLWPQVVGPMQEGHIVEPTYDDIAETPLELQLKGVRGRSQLEMATRQHVRDLLNSPGQQKQLQMPPLFYELQMHPLLEQHLEMFPFPLPYVSNAGKIQ